jgi:hypothetical protein
MSKHDDELVSAELKEFLTRYQDVVSRGDRAGFSAMYHPAATVAYVNGDGLVTVNFKVFADEVAKTVESGNVVREETLNLKIEIAGNVALLRVDFALQIGRDHFKGTDFYTLARLKSEWRITQKLYEMQQV